MVELLRAYDVTVPLLGRLARGVDRLVRRWQVNRTAAALENLTDQLLADIGVARDQIPAIALRATERVPRAPASFIAQQYTKEGHDIMIGESSRTSSEQTRCLALRPNAWHRDATASALSLARWEDDGGRPEHGKTFPISLATRGRTSSQDSHHF